MTKSSTAFSKTFKMRAKISELDIISLESKMMKHWFPTLILGAFAITACNEKRLEPEAPSELRGDEIESKTNSQDAFGKGEEVSPPAQISGSYLKAAVLASEATNNGWQTQIAVNAYYRNKRVQDNPRGYTVSLTVANTGSQQGIRVSQTATSPSEYDQTITIQGPNQDAIERAYKSIMLYTTIVDKSDYSSVSISSSLDEIVHRP